MLSKKSLALLLVSTALAGEECCYLAPARPFAPECFGFHVSVDPVVWQARVGGTGIAIQTKGSDDFFNGGGHSRVQNLNYDWDWGFRLGVGVNTSHDAWDILLQWTHWNTDAKRDISNSVNFSHFGHPEELGSAAADAVKSQWKLDYDLLDLEIAREFWLSSCISIRPFGGLRTAWIHQKEFDVDLRDVVFHPQADGQAVAYLRQRDRRYSQILRHVTKSKKKDHKGTLGPE